MPCHDISLFRLASSLPGMDLTDPLLRFSEENEAARARKLLLKASRSSKSTDKPASRPRRERKRPKPTPRARSESTSSVRSVALPLASTPVEVESEHEDKQVIKHVEEHKPEEDTPVVVKSPAVSEPSVSPSKSRGSEYNQRSALDPSPPLEQPHLQPFQWTSYPSTCPNHCPDHAIDYHSVPTYQAFKIQSPQVQLSYQQHPSWDLPTPPCDAAPAISYFPFPPSVLMPPHRPPLTHTSHHSVPAPLYHPQPTYAPSMIDVAYPTTPDLVPSGPFSSCSDYPTSHQSAADGSYFNFVPHSFSSEPYYVMEQQAAALMGGGCGAATEMMSRGSSFVGMGGMLSPYPSDDGEEGQMTVGGYEDHYQMW